MKRFILTTLALTQVFISTRAQVSGNASYQNTVTYASSNINVSFPTSPDLFINVKGLANVKADSYVAVFSITQVGKSPEEVNRLLDERIGQAVEKIGQQEGVETYVDMISFVPMYEYEAQKKIFSKTTYNEIPAGFELKKNLHVKYNNSAFLNEVIATLANVEVYDLVRVDYFSESLEEVKKELMTKAKRVLQEKLKVYESMLSSELDSAERYITDGYTVILPAEAYESYQAYSSNSLNLEKPTNVSQTRKTSAQYYQPILDKEFDFVIDPVVFEPVIQVLYEIKLSVKRDNKPKVVRVPKTSKDYLFVTPEGEVKRLDLLN